MSELSDFLDRLREERPDLFRHRTRIQVGLIVVDAIEDLTDNGFEATDDAVIAWIADNFPDSRRKRGPGRPPLNCKETVARYRAAVWELRALGNTHPTDAEVGEQLGYEDGPGTISYWRKKCALMPREWDIPQ